MTNTTVVRARIDERTKRQAAAALKNIGLTVSDAFRLLMVRVAAEKALRRFDIDTRLGAKALGYFEAVVKNHILAKRGKISGGGKCGGRERTTDVKRSGIEQQRIHGAATGKIRIEIGSAAIGNI